MDNYEIAKRKAGELFLQQNVEDVICRNSLSSDSDSIFVNYLYHRYIIDRKTGIVYRCDISEKHCSCGHREPFERVEAGYSESLSIFDLLCHPGEKSISGNFAAVNSLKNGPVASGVEMNQNCKLAGVIDADPESFRIAMKKLGAVEEDLGDISFRLKVFAELEMLVKFYFSDDEFPASLTLLWDSNMLQYVNYETVFYIAGDVIRLIDREIKAVCE